MSRYAQNMFYLGFDQQDTKGTGVAPTLFPEYFDGDIGINPEMDYTHYTPAGGQFVNLGLLEKVRVPLSWTMLGTPEMSGVVAGYTLGKEQIKGTQPASPNATTLASAVTAGATDITVATGDGSNYTSGDYVQLVSVSDASEDTGEIRIVDSIATDTITLTTALSYDHDSGDVVEEVETPFVHKNKYADRNNMPWFSAEVSAGYDSDQADPIIARFIDCRVASLSISAESGMPLMFNPTVQAINLEKEATETSESYEDNDPLIFYQGTYTLDGGATTNITNFTFDLTNTLDEDDFTNAVIREDLPVIGREGTVSFTLKLEDGTRFWDTYMNSADDAIAEALETGDFNAKLENDSTLAGSAGYRAIEIDAPALDHVSATANPGTGDGSMEYECEAVINKGTSDFLTVTSTNDNHLKGVI